MHSQYSIYVLKATTAKVTHVLEGSVYVSYSGNVTRLNNFIFIFPVFVNGHKTRQHYPKNLQEEENHGTMLSRYTVKPLKMDPLKQRGLKMRPHRDQITMPTGSIPNAYNGYICIPDPQQ